MQKLSLFVFVVLLGTSVSAQSKFVESKTATDALIAAEKYCTNVEDYSDSQVPRIFAPASVNEQSTGWVEFETRAAWRRAGSPKPVAFVWYRDSMIVRVAISANDHESVRRLYADYCYRQDGTLARLRSVPSEQRICEPNRNRCTRVLREARFYPPEGPPLKIYGLDMPRDVDDTTGMVLIDALPAERIFDIFAPMKWPEYLRVGDLPFYELLYATVR